MRVLLILLICSIYFSVVNALCFLQEVEAITLELEELKREHASCEQQLEAVNEAIKSYEGQIEMMAAEVAKSKVRFTYHIEEIPNVNLLIKHGLDELNFRALNLFTQQ